MELHGGVSRVIFHPSRHAEFGQPAVSMMFETTALAATWRVQRMSHCHSAKKKFK
jgi:hypothetical protein